jgi:diguanylate cyclase (GGDEF)-like protein
MLERIRLAYEASRSSKQHNALLLLDIDNFHLINDKFSSVVGDDILIEMRNRLVDLLPEIDNLARIGADSFCVLFPDISTDKRKALHNTIDLANQIQAVLTIPFDILQNRFSISVSMGAVLFADEEDFEVDQIIGFAESAQLLSKKEGINRLNFYQNELQQLAINNLLVENELRFALPDQLKVFYQLQFDSKKNIAGSEALIRWQHPHKGMLSPDKFISIAEESGLILPIGYWLFDTVFHQISLWNNHLITKMKNVPVSVNISVKQFYDPDLIDYLVCLLKKYEISPSLIKLEITETLMMENFSYFKKIFAQLRGLGFQLSLDDFGVGYSSLSVISEMDFDEIKIDKSFIDCLVDSTKSQTIVKMIVALGKELNVNLVAEGIENIQQYRLLIDLGVDCFQGYLFSYPLPVEDLNLKEH